MKSIAKSIRPFIGSKDFEVSRAFYRDLGFTEYELSHNLSLFRLQEVNFYLQDYYAKEWVENLMLFVEVENVEEWWQEMLTLDLPAKYEGVQLTPIRTLEWGRECFVHDPAGILWHFGQFNGK